MSDNKKLIFIACGQREQQEVDLGKKIAELVNSRPNLKSFLAENTHSFGGLTSEIFDNLNSCSGFIAILHHRHKCADENKIFSSSLWINQEIGITAFLTLRDKKDMPLRVFKESNQNGDIKIDGILEYLMVNPIPFSKDEEVIKIIKEWLEETNFGTTEESKDYLLKGKRIIKLLAGYTGDLHTYRLDLEIANIGKKTVEDISFEFYFPKGLSPQEYNIRKLERSESTRRELKDFYCFKQKISIPKLLPGKSEPVYCFDFIVNHDIYFGGYTHKNMIWKIYADDMEPIEDMAPLEGPIGEGINF